MWSWYTGRWCVGSYISYREEETGRGRSLPSPLLAVPNITAHPSTASVGLTITVLLYNGPLLCSVNVPNKWLSWSPIVKHNLIDAGCTEHTKTKFSVLVEARPYHCRPRSRLCCVTAPRDHGLRGLVKDSKPRNQQLL